MRAGGTTFLLSAACAPAEGRLTSWAPAECGVPPGRLPPGALAPPRLPIAPPGPPAAGRQDQEPGWGGGGAAGGCKQQASSCGVRLRLCAGARCARAGCLPSWRLRWVGVGGMGIGNWELELQPAIYVLDKWAGPKGYLGQNLCMVRVHPRVKF